MVNGRRRDFTYDDADRLLSETWIAFGGGVVNTDRLNWAAIERGKASARLKATLSELHDRLTTHRAALDGIAGNVRQVNAEARQLEAWADGILAPDRRRR